jgi:lyso-ornithine lipid O-acyltransferase
MFRASCRLLFFVALTVGHAAALAARTLGQTDVDQGQRQAQRWARQVLRALGVEVHGTMGVAPMGALYVANHRSYIDIPALLACAPVTFLAKDEISRWPVLGRAARCAGTMFVKREARASRGAARASIAEQLSLGRSVAVFPEGTTTAGPGLTTLKPGSFDVAAGRFPVVPVAIHHEHRDDAWIGDDGFVVHFLRRFGVRERRVTLRFGPPLYDQNPMRLRAKVDAWLRRELADLDQSNFPLEEMDHEEAIQHPRAA